MIVSVLNLKGGVGKTTTVMHLAAVAASEGQVTVLDADNEASAYEWAVTGALRKQNLPVERANQDGLARQARALSKTGHVIIDGPPNNRELLWSAATVADRVVIPIAPSGVDINRLRSTIEVLLDIEASKGELNTRILLTKWDSRRVVARDTLELLRDFPVLEAKVRNLERYNNSFGTLPRYLYEYTQVWRELLRD